MGFRLVTISSDSSDRKRPMQVPSLPNKVDPHAEFLVRLVNELARDKPDLWAKARAAFLRDYHPVWDRIDGHDILVAWAAAGYKLARSKTDLDRVHYGGNRPTARQRAAREAKLTDIRFWGRLVPLLEPKAIAALSNDETATRTLEAVVRRFQAGNSKR